MWRWKQSTGELSRDGKFISPGYSGKGRGKNNPAMQGVVGFGPIPCGKWRLTQKYVSPNVGPYAIRLEAQDGTVNDTHDATGRGAFRIHGDSVRAPGTASRGCIILPRAIRVKMWEGKDHELEVVA